MEARSLDFIVAACGGELRGGAPGQMIRGISTDSRRVQVGDLFVALAGERFEGHDFLGEVLHKGPGALLFQREKAPAQALGCALVALDNTRLFLGRADHTFVWYTNAPGANPPIVGSSTHCSLVDYDNDGDPDILVLRGAWLMDEDQIRKSRYATTETARSRM